MVDRNGEQNQKSHSVLLARIASLEHEIDGMRHGGAFSRAEPGYEQLQATVKELRQKCAESQRLEREHQALSVGAIEETQRLNAAMDERGLGVSTEAPRVPEQGPLDAAARKRITDALAGFVFNGHHATGVREGKHAASGFCVTCADQYFAGQDALCLLGFDFSKAASHG